MNIAVGNIAVGSHAMTGLLYCCAARYDVQTERRGRRANMWDWRLTCAILMFVPAADTREAWKVSTDQAYQAST